MVFNSEMCGSCTHYAIHPMRGEKILPIRLCNLVCLDLVLLFVLNLTCHKCAICYQLPAKCACLIGRNFYQFRNGCGNGIVFAFENIKNPLLENNVFLLRRGHRILLLFIRFIHLANGFGGISLDFFVYSAIRYESVEVTSSHLFHGKFPFFVGVGRYPFLDYIVPQPFGIVNTFFYFFWCSKGRLSPLQRVVLRYQSSLPCFPFPWNNYSITDRERNVNPFPKKTLLSF